MHFSCARKKTKSEVRIKDIEELSLQSLGTLQCYHGTEELSKTSVIVCAASSVTSLQGA